MPDNFEKEIKDMIRDALIENEPSPFDSLIISVYLSVKWFIAFFLLYMASDVWGAADVSKTIAIMAVFVFALDWFPKKIIHKRKLKQLDEYYGKQ